MATQMVQTQIAILNIARGIIETCENISSPTHLTAGEVSEMMRDRGITYKEMKSWVCGSVQGYTIFV